jgi:hypothetical protein
MKRLIIIFSVIAALQLNATTAYVECVCKNKKSGKNIVYYETAQVGDNVNDICKNACKNDGGVKKVTVLQATTA